MNLKAWIEQQAKKKGQSRAAVIRELAEKSGVTTTTIENVFRGLKLVLYPKAKAISDATGGEVRIEEMCE